METFEKLRDLALLTIFLTSIFSLPCFADDGIGLYFDEAGIINCLPDSSSFPQERSGFLILKNCSAVGGVGGWECALSLPPGCFILESDFGPNSLNVATAPEFIVGLGVPIPQSSIMVLATFSFLFTSPGEIYLHSPEVNSVEGVLGPVYAEGGNLNNLIPTGYSYGSPFHPVATVGVQSCPQDSLFQETDISGEINLEIVPLSDLENIPPRRHISNELTKAIDWELMRRYTDIGFHGQVLDWEVECYYNHRGRKEGVVKFSLDVQEVYWGPDSDLIEVFVPGVEVPGCILYDSNLKFDDFSLIEIGQQIDIFASHLEGVYWSFNHRVFISPGIKGREEVLDKSQLREIGRNSMVINNYSKADFVGLVEVKMDGGIRSYSVSQVLVGRNKLNGRKIPLHPSAGRSIWETSDEGRWPVLCFLKMGDDGDFFRLNQKERIFARTDKGFYSPSGLPAPYFIFPDTSFERK